MQVPVVATSCHEGRKFHELILWGLLKVSCVHLTLTLLLATSFHISEHGKCHQLVLHVAQFGEVHRHFEDIVNSGTGAVICREDVEAQ
jgi:D-lyxose ketol-isomerase